MELKNIHVLTDINTNDKSETDINISDQETLNNCHDFIERYKDEDGILRIRTFFNHDDISEHDLWEVFVPENSAQSFKFLLSTNNQERKFCNE